MAGGAEADFGEWPWYAKLIHFGHGHFKDTFFCGGSLLNNQWIITAAHCIDE